MRSLSARRTDPVLAVITVGVLLALTGCGSATKTVIASSPPQVATIGSTATKTTSERTAEPLVHLAAFLTPSGNIGCMIAGGVARCDIEHRSWKPPARPSSCPDVVDFGQGLEIGSSGPAQFVCAGDTSREPGAPKLAYGSATEAEGFTCSSRRDGLSCKRSSDGHGFFISIQSYRVF
ncbi:MAG TPA: DUF6636 domain-containing protein [Solirubrobacteraceae bacterium]|nr:DUF6636 domain-containing protein [Solirubrobacteraceae bacterium]